MSRGGVGGLYPHAVPPSPPCLPLHEGIHRAAMQWDQTLCSLHPDVQLTRGRLPRTCGVGGGGSGPGGAALPPSLRPPLTFRAGGDEFECQVEVSSVGEAVCGYGGLRWGGRGVMGGVGRGGGRETWGYGVGRVKERTGLWGAVGHRGGGVMGSYGVGRSQGSMGLWGGEEAGFYGAMGQGGPEKEWGCGGCVGWGGEEAEL